MLTGHWNWETTLEISDFLGEHIKLGGSARAFGEDVTELIKEEAVLPAFPGASLIKHLQAQKADGFC